MVANTLRATIGAASVGAYLNTPPGMSSTLLILPAALVSNTAYATNTAVSVLSFVAAGAIADMRTLTITLSDEEAANISAGLTVTVGTDAATGAETYTAANASTVSDQIWAMLRTKQGVARAPSGASPQVPESTMGLVPFLTEMFEEAGSGVWNPQAVDTHVNAAKLTTDLGLAWTNNSNPLKILSTVFVAGPVSLAAIQTAVGFAGLAVAGLPQVAAYQLLHGNASAGWSVNQSSGVVSVTMEPGGTLVFVIASPGAVFSRCLALARPFLPYAVFDGTKRLVFDTSPFPSLYTGDWTIELFVTNMSNASETTGVISLRNWAGDPPGNSLAIVRTQDVIGNKHMSIFIDNGLILDSPRASLPPGHADNTGDRLHLGVMRSGNDIGVLLDGTAVMGNASSILPNGIMSTKVFLGDVSSWSNMLNFIPFTGRIESARISNTARYTVSSGMYTAPTSLGDDGNVLFLMVGDGQGGFKDAKTNTPGAWVS